MEPGALATDQAARLLCGRGQRVSWSRLLRPRCKRKQPERSRESGGPGLRESGLDHSILGEGLLTPRLGGVDGFDDDEAQSKCDEGSEVLVRLLAAERHPLETLQLAHKLLDAGAGAIERLREERRPVLGR